MLHINLASCWYVAVIILLGSGVEALFLKPLSVSASSSSALATRATDGFSNTSWTSGACLAGGWRSNPDLNSLYMACAAGSSYCSGTCDAVLTASTDGSGYTAGSAVMNSAQGLTWANFIFPNGPVNTSYGIYLRGIWPVNVTVMGLLDYSGTTRKIGTVGPAKNYLDLTFPGPRDVLLTGLYLQTQTRDGVMRGFCYSGIGDW